MPSPLTSFQLFIGSKILFWFSLSGVVFLSSIAFLLQINSIYVLPTANNKPSLARGVWGAVGIYTMLFLASCLFLLKSDRAELGGNEVTRRQDDDNIFQDSTSEEIERLIK
jgi:hypothetical protein